MEQNLIYYVAGIITVILFIIQVAYRVKVESKESVNRVREGFKKELRLIQQRNTLANKDKIAKRIGK